jgi:hypothetical protein
MSYSKYYRLDGRTPVPCTLEQWTVSFGQDNRIVAQEEIEGVMVSTVFLAMDHNWSDKGPPLLFETMTFCESFGQVQLRCSTYMQAEEMHVGVVDLVRTSFDQAEETAQQAIKKLKEMAS